MCGGGMGVKAGRRSSHSRDPVRAVGPGERSKEQHVPCVGVKVRYCRVQITLPPYLQSDLCVHRVGSSRLFCECNGSCHLHIYPVCYLIHGKAISLFVPYCPTYPWLGGWWSSSRCGRLAGPPNR